MQSGSGKATTDFGLLPIEDTPTPSYTARKKSKSLRAVEPDRNEPLSGLRLGHPVTLYMDDPTPGPTIRRVSEPKKRMIILTPRPWAGAPRNVVLVSVIGKGSAVVQSGNTGKIANLVLAGINPRLATALMDQLHRVFIRR